MCVFYNTTIFYSRNVLPEVFGKVMFFIFVVVSVVDGAEKYVVV